MSSPKKISDLDDQVIENLKKVKVIYSDLDGSMLGPGGNFFLSAERRPVIVPAEKLVALKKAGIEIVLVSGRSHIQLSEMARMLGVSDYIAEMGCQIVYGRTDIHPNYGYDQSGGSLYDSIDKSGAPRLLLDTYRGRLEYHLPWSENRLCTHLFRGSVDTAEANDLLNAEGLGDLKLIDNGRIRTRGGLTFVGRVNAYHLLPADSGKASAVSLDRRRRTVDKGEAIAIGDAVADLEMADNVGCFFLIDNGNVGAEMITGAENIYVTTEKMGLGWAEVIALITG